MVRAKGHKDGGMGDGQARLDDHSSELPPFLRRDNRQGSDGRAAGLAAQEARNGQGGRNARRPAERQAPDGQGLVYRGKREAYHRAIQEEARETPQNERDIHEREPRERDRERQDAHSEMGAISGEIEERGQGLT